MVAAKVLGGLRRSEVLGRGRLLSVDGQDEMLAAARHRVGLAHATCHELRHTCLAWLRDAGMALEAMQAQHDDAEAKGQQNRAELFRRLFKGITEDEAS